MIARGLFVIVAALLLAVQVMRNAAVQGLAETRPAAAARFWAEHPSVELSLGMLEIGRAARKRAKASPAAFAMIEDAARKAPLAPEPYLVRGVEAQLDGDTAQAKRDFSAAQWRDPRSLPAAYFLAEYYFRSGNAVDGLRQTAVLARLSPGGVGAVAPYLAAYAQAPSNWPQIRALFRNQPGIEDAVLVALAHEAGNSDAILQLADPAHRNAASPWLPVLLGSLVDAGDYVRARAIWAAISGVAIGPRTLIYDASFEASDAPPPFNWSLTSSTVGLAEREGGGLHVLFYGQNDGVLARQLLLLPPGSYRLRFTLGDGGVHPESLSWSIRCDKSASALSSAGIDATTPRGWSFRVPPDCPAQWLELTGRSEDISQQSDVTIGGLKLERSNGRG
ncbi:MAG TPA: hypothetical protein VFM42_06135 [Sphingomicrobium sp.]|nr:hypothetical protein [Sphingomicrobium sp.]